MCLEKSLHERTGERVRATGTNTKGSLRQPDKSIIEKRTGKD